MNESIEVPYLERKRQLNKKRNREIIISSGAIGSHQILQVSGIGNPEKLKNLGIDMVQNLNGVGENLHDHLMLRPIYKINGLKSLNKKINSLFGNLIGFFSFISFIRSLFKGKL